MRINISVLDIVVETKTSLRYNIPVVNQYQISLDIF